MKRWEKIVSAIVVIPIAVFTIYVVGVLAVRNYSKRKKHDIIPDEVVEERHRRETTFATENDIDTTIQIVELEEIISETIKFSQIENNTNENRKSFCIELFREAGYEPLVTDSGDVIAIQEGFTSDYIAVGAHYDKVEGPSEGILDNMLGCILISNIAEIFRDKSTNFTYIFLTYGGEETGRKIGSATSGYRSGSGGRPTYVIEIDYVGDKNADLGGKWLGPIGGRFINTGIRINTYPMPKPGIIHTEKDNISNVDFNKAYLAFKTVIALIEGIEKGDGLIPPNTVNFWRKDKPLLGK